MEINMLIKNTYNTINTIQNSKVYREYEYKAKREKGSYFTTFKDITSNKKVEINLPDDLVKDLSTKFNSDIKIKGKAVKVTGKAKEYLETMWQKFRYELNFKDNNHNNKLDADEYIQAKKSVAFEELNYDDNKANYSSLKDHKNFFISKHAYNTAIEETKKDFNRNLNWLDFNIAFVTLINDDQDFDTVITNKNYIDSQSKLAKQGGKNFPLGQNRNLKLLNTELILKWLEQKKDEIKNDILPIKELSKVKFSKKLPQQENLLAYIIDKIEFNERTKNIV